MWLSSLSQWFEEFLFIIKLFPPITKVPALKYADPTLHKEEQNEDIVAVEDSLTITSMILEKCIQLKLIEVLRFYKQGFKPKKRKYEQQDCDSECAKSVVLYSKEKDKIKELDNEKVIIRLSSKLLNSIANKRKKQRSKHFGDKKRQFTLGTYPILSESDSSPFTSSEKLCWMFRNCINFVTPSNLSRVKDVDSVLQDISSFGKISYIQDHWAYSEVTNQFNIWRGALVKYRYTESCDNVLKKVLIGDISQLMMISVPHHLHNLAKCEFLLTQYNPSISEDTTTIVINGVRGKRVRDGLLEELKNYAEFLSMHFTETACVVTYKYTVEAYATALGLDGKAVCRNVLTTCVAMKRKELSIHYKLYHKYDFWT